MKYATVYQRKGKLFVRSSDKTVAGFHLDQDNTVAVDESDNERIGASVKAALAASRNDIAVPSREAISADVASNLYSLAGVRSWREFVKGAKYISVVSSDDEVVLTPYERDSRRAGFIPLEDLDHVVSAALSDADLGVAVMAALADAE